MVELKRPAWVKDKTVASDFSFVEGSFDPYKDWVMDPVGYVLIRVNADEGVIELAHCTYNHVITKAVRGRTAQEVYVTAIKLGMVSRLDHAAYLGKELRKAEIALQMKTEYVQE